MNSKNKLFLIIACIICLISSFILISSIINIVQKQYIVGSFYTLQELIVILIISSLIAVTSITYILFHIKTK